MFGKIALLFVALSAATLANADEISLRTMHQRRVSSSGDFPSELMEQRFYTQLNWRSFAPYYLFAVSAISRVTVCRRRPPGRRPVRPVAGTAYAPTWGPPRGSGTCGTDPILLISVHESSPTGPVPSTLADQASEAWPPEYREPGAQVIARTWLACGSPWIRRICRGRRLHVAHEPDQPCWSHAPSNRRSCAPARGCRPARRQVDVLASRAELLDIATGVPRAW